MMIYFFSFAIYLIHFKFVGIKDMHNIYYLGLSGEHRCPFGYLLFNSLRMNGQNLTKFCIDLIIDKIYLGIVNSHFSQICNRVTTLD